MKSLTLSPTKSPGVYSVMLSDGYQSKCIGRFFEVSGTFTTRRCEKRHLFRNTKSLAICEAVLNELPGLKLIEIIFTHNNGKVQSLKTSKDYLLRFGKRAAFASTGFEAQVFLNISAFSMSKALRYQSEINSQLSLFSGVA